MNRWAGIARFGGIGDNLIAASVLAPLKRMGYMTDVITGEPNHVVFLNNPHMDKLSIKQTDRDLPQNDMERWQAWIESRAKEYDLFLHASHSCEGRHAIFKTMTAFWWPAEYRRKICAGSYLETVHDIMGVPHEFGPLYFPTDEEKENAARVKESIGKCIVWIVSGTRIDKVYPSATMAVARIVREVGAQVVLMGGPSDKEHSMVTAIRDHVTRQNGTRDGVHCAVPAVGGGEQAWPIRSSLAFVHGADLVVTPDTGPAWAVAFEPTPKIVMVSHASAENITKHWINTTTLHADPERVPCWPCHRLHDDTSTCVPNKDNNGAACLTDIDVETLVETVRRRWNGLPALGGSAKYPNWRVERDRGQDAPDRLHDATRSGSGGDHAIPQQPGPDQNVVGLAGSAEYPPPWPVAQAAAGSPTFPAPKIVGVPYIPVATPLYGGPMPIGTPWRR